MTRIPKIAQLKLTLQAPFVGKWVNRTIALDVSVQNYGVKFRMPSVCMFCYVLRVRRVRPALLSVSRHVGCFGHSASSIKHHQRKANDTSGNSSARMILLAVGMLGGILMSFCCCRSAAFKKQKVSKVSTMMLIPYSTMPHSKGFSKITTGRTLVNTKWVHL